MNDNLQTIQRFTIKLHILRVWIICLIFNLSSLPYQEMLKNQKLNFFTYLKFFTTVFSDVYKIWKLIRVYVTGSKK